jgi:type IV pilus assembly protein PilE
MSRKGFTLLELIVVIIIVGVLATLGFVQYANVIEKGRRAEAAANLSSMRSIALIWNQEGQPASSYPDTTNLNALLGTTANPFPTGTTGTCANANYYFQYSMDGTTGTGTATRCTTLGKPPQGGNADTLSLTITGGKSSVPANLW